MFDVVLGVLLCVNVLFVFVCLCLVAFSFCWCSFARRSHRFLFVVVVSFRFPFSQLLSLLCEECCVTVILDLMVMFLAKGFVPVVVLRSLLAILLPMMVLSMSRKKFPGLHRFYFSFFCSFSVLLFFLTLFCMTVDGKLEVTFRAFLVCSPLEETGICFILAFLMFSV